MIYTTDDIVYLIVLLVIIAYGIVLLIYWAKKYWEKVKRFWTPSKDDNGKEKI